MLPPRLQAMVEELKASEDLTEKYEVLIELGKKVPDIPASEKNDRNFIRGCQSVVHVYGEMKDGKLEFHGHADALVVNGLLALLVLGLSGLTPREFLEVEPDFIKETGVLKTLTPSRVNGFYNIHQAMKHRAEEALGGKP